jgi:hypothetical protein
MTKLTLATMNNWTDKAKRNTALVMRSSVQKLVEDIVTDVGAGEGQTPIDTGNLRNSLQVSTVSMPTVKDGEFSDPSGTNTLAIAGAEIGDTIWIGFQAAYARRLNYGFTGEDSLGRNYNQSGRFFVESKAAKWQKYVDDAAKEVGRD